ncbi:hypothetical protein BH18ACT4_BH18ACT4_01370 [soil metagenome]
MSPVLVPLVLCAVAAAFVLSASAGWGGSLILVPVLALLLGEKEGVALASLLLAGNNVVKVGAYRANLPFRQAAVVVVVTSLGALIGARLLVASPEELVALAVVAAVVASFAAERSLASVTVRASGPPLAFAAGATSGFAGTPGPLKGVALRSLGLDRIHLVGAASIVSLAGDATKSAVFDGAGLLGATSLALCAAAAPVMIAATLAGRRINRRLGETGYHYLFWTVMAGYCLRLAA